MPEPTEDERKEAMEFMGGFMLSLILALVLSKIAFTVATRIGAGDYWAGLVDIFVMFSILIIDPVSAYRKGVSRADWLRKLAIGALGGVIVAFIFSFDLVPSESIATADNPDTEDRPFPYGIFAVVLLFPLFFLFPIFERYLKGRPNTELPASEDISISMVFPIYMTMMMGLNFLVVGSLWLLAVPLTLALLLFVGVVLFAVAEVWTAEEHELLELEDDRWAPRAKSAQEAWAGLRRAVRPTITSALFLGTTLYICMKAAAPAVPDTADGIISDPTGLLTTMLTMVGITIGGFIVLLFAATLTIAAAAWVIARQKGADPLTMGELAAQANARLLMGGIQYVRPDQETD